jgi:U3 small nucleolar ribonucleoprotein protein LCP5
MSGPLDSSLPILLSTLTASLESAAQVLPDEAKLFPPEHGLSLLNTKNELFLSYLENLVFLILIKLKHLSTNTTSEPNEHTKLAALHRAAVEKLAELRLHLDRGVRPLEARLKYQIDKVVRAAEDAGRPAAPRRAVASAGSRPRGKVEAGDDNDYADSDDGSPAASDDDGGSSDASADELAFRPNPSSFARAGRGSAPASAEQARGDGVYVPPRITATALPTTQPAESRRRAKPKSSRTLDEFVATELSAAPVAEPSVGSAIRAGGRSTLTRAQREDVARRTRYEEENFVRLPKETRRERAKKGGGGKRREGFGGEDWGDLNGVADRIGGLTNRKAGSKLERSRKRQRVG